jgi:hypothetical protein
MRIELRKVFRNIFHSRSFLCPSLTRNPRIPFGSSAPYTMAARPTDVPFVREDLDDLLKRRFFISRGFDIYGGVAGLYDLGVHLA